MTGDRVDLDEARQRILSEALEAVDGSPPAVGSFALATGGNSHEVWIADVERPSGPERLVLRCDPDDWIRPEEMEREIHGLRIAAEMGVPVPRVIATHHDRPADRPYIVVEHVAGEAIGPRIQRKPEYERARRRFAEQCGTFLGRMTRASAEALAVLEPREPVSEVRRRYELVPAPSPVLAGAIEWLHETAPPLVEDHLVHGDFRLGNLMVDHDGIAAVLDWEMAHRGDPYEDIAWLCLPAWRYRGTQPVGGIGPLEELVAAFEAASGTSFDLDRFKWWSVWGATLWALASREQSVASRTRPGDAMESAAIARQACVQEGSVLDALEEFVR